MRIRSPSFAAWVVTIATLVVCTLGVRAELAQARRAGTVIEAATH